MYSSLKVNIKNVLHQYTSQNVSFSVSDNKVEELENLLISKICHNRRDVGLRLLKYTLIKEVEVIQRRQEELS
jgi:hypothetical protein